jgi:hypothetical protein
MVSLTTIFNTSAGQGTEAHNNAPTNTLYSQREPENSLIG